MAAALPPATLEGWYALHQMFAVDWARLGAESADRREALLTEAAAHFSAAASDAGWSAAFQLVGGGADLLFVHFRESIDEIGGVETALRRSRLAAYLRLEYDYLSVTEAGLYHLTAEVAREHEPGTEGYDKAIAERSAQEGASHQVKSRLYPRIPEEMRYVSFYPMSKRRVAGDNWYLLPIDVRSQLMRDHGLTGRRYAGRILQVITGSIGLDDWEWGVTLFARDPLEFKRIVTDMRFDEVSARYGEFGRFFTGIRLEASDWQNLFAP
ncbi:MAG: heme-dependent peroxidase [Gemmatimonadetes bacterium]|nr:heme-dependent peroxidase [Gemmatimonadota bacterium]